MEVKKAWLSYVHLTFVCSSSCLRCVAALCGVLSSRQSSLLPCAVSVSLKCPLCFHHTAAPLQSIESARSLQYFRSALLASSYLSTVHCDLGKVQSISTQSMLLINHVSFSSTTEVQEELGSGQTLFSAQANCEVAEVSGSKLEIWPLAHQPASH